MWRSRVARSLRELGLISVAALVLIGLLLTGIEWVLYPLAVLSAAGVLMMLTLLDTIILCVITRQENKVQSWRAAVWPLLAGATLALVQVAVSLLKPG